MHTFRRFPYLSDIIRYGLFVNSIYLHTCTCIYTTQEFADILLCIELAIEVIYNGKYHLFFLDAVCKENGNRMVLVNMIPLSAMKLFS